LGKNLHFLIEEGQHRLESITPLPDGEHISLLLASDRLDQRIIGSQVTTVAPVTLAAGKWSVIIVPINAFGICLVELPGVIDGLAGSDESNVDLGLVSGCTERPWPVERNTGLRVAVTVSACE